MTWAADLTGDIRDLADRYVDRGARGPGLYVQLRQATGTGSSPMTGTIGRSHPYSRPPGRIGIISLIRDIDDGSRTLYRDLGGEHPPADTRQVLRRLPNRVASRPRELERVARQVGRWHTASRTALTWLAPIMTLRHPCPYCGGPLRTRSDASTDIWCANGYADDGDAALCVNPETGREYRWARTTWRFLLVTLVTEEANA